MCLFWNCHFDKGERMILGVSHKQIQALNTVLIQRMHSNQNNTIQDDSESGDGHVQSLDKGLIFSLSSFHLEKS